MAPPQSYCLWGVAHELKYIKTCFHAKALSEHASLPTWERTQLWKRKWMTWSSTVSTEYRSSWMKVACEVRKCSRCVWFLQLTISLMLWRKFYLLSVSVFEGSTRAQKHHILLPASNIQHGFNQPTVKYNSARETGDREHKIWTREIMNSSFTVCSRWLGSRSTLMMWASTKVWAYETKRLLRSVWSLFLQECSSSSNFRMQHDKLLIVKQSSEAKIASKWNMWANRSCAGISCGLFQPWAAEQHLQSTK